MQGFRWRPRGGGSVWSYFSFVSSIKGVRYLEKGRRSFRLDDRMNGGAERAWSNWRGRTFGMNRVIFLIEISFKDALSIYNIHIFHFSFFDLSKKGELFQNRTIRSKIER